MKADKTSLELAIIEAYAHLEDSKPSPTDGGTTFSRFSNGERNWTVPCARVSRAPEATGTRGTLNSVFERELDVGFGKWEGSGRRGVSIPYALATWSERDRSRESEVS